MTTKTESVAMFPNAFLHEAFTESPNVIIVNDSRMGERMCFLHADGKWIPASSKHESPYIFHRDEATFRLTLYQSPREALRPFLDAKELEYTIETVLLCHKCATKRGYTLSDRLGGTIWELGSGPCPGCGAEKTGQGEYPNGTSTHLLLGATDWFEEHGMELEAQVCRDVLGGRGE